MTDDPYQSSPRHTIEFVALALACCVFATFLVVNVISCVREDNAQKADEYRLRLRVLGGRGLVDEIKP